MNEQGAELFPEPVEPKFATEPGTMSPEPGELEPVNGDGQIVGLGVNGLGEIARSRAVKRTSVPVEAQLSARDRLNRAPIRDSRQEERIKRSTRIAEENAAVRRRKARARASRPSDNPAQ